MPNKINSVRWTAIQKLVLSALPREEGFRLVAWWKHLYKYKGPEFLALRVKNLWNIALLIKSEEFEKAESLSKDSSIRIRNWKTGKSLGVEGVLVAKFAAAKKPAVVRRLAAVLRAYTLVVLPAPSTKQIAKCEKTITGQSQCRELTTEGRVIYDDQGNKIIDMTDFTHYHVNESKLKFPRVDELSGTTSYPTLDRLLSKTKKELPFLSLISSLSSKGLVPESLSDFWDHKSPAMGLLRCKAMSNQMKADDFTFGKIQILQEGGAKGRTICSPNAWVQLYLKPFHNALCNMINRLEKSPMPYGISCMMDQVKGGDIVLKRLNNGEKVYCVDLSAATDRFPLKLQTEVARMLGMPTLAKAFDELKGPYISPKGDQWYYNAGQPMGAYGSFALFHFSHFVLLYTLCKRLALNENSIQFLVLGDDVVIFNEKLLSLYKKTLTYLGVETSENKSFVGEVSEFAGFITIPCRDNRYTIFRPYKWKEGGEFTDVLNVYHAFGAKAQTLGPYWKKHYNLYQRGINQMDIALSPLVPSDDDKTSCVKVNSPGAKYIASLITRLSYISNHDIAFSYLFERAHIEHIMLQKHESYPGEFDDERNIDKDVTFEPSEYVSQETARKKFWRNFFKNPIIGTLTEQDFTQAWMQPTF